MDDFFWIILFWFLFVGFLAICITVYDKVSAIKHGQRVPEKTLLILGLIGGATEMFITMLLIRHKTRHLKFMLTLPVFMLLHGALLFLLSLYLV